jgi:hypothetical protein
MGAELQICLLHQFVNQALVRSRPPADGFDDGPGDYRLRAPDELSPEKFITVRLEGEIEQFVQGQAF